MMKRFIDAGLCSGQYTPTQETAHKGLCRIQRTWANHVLVLWDRAKIVLALAVARKPPVNTHTTKDHANWARERLAHVRVVTVAATLLFHAAQRNRVLRLLRNYRRWDLPKPTVIVTVHDEQERKAAVAFGALAHRLADFQVTPQRTHSDARRKAVEQFWQSVDADAKGYELNRAILHLRRRGGIGAARFIDTFVGGIGTTCEKWTPQGGFLQAGVTGGHCPVGCRVCYLQGPYREAMQVYLNVEDLQAELRQYTGYNHPINFTAKSGVIEYDPWFSDDDGRGSLAQFVIDSCAAAKVSPLFLTKTAFPRYLRFHGTVHVGVSLMPESVRQAISPFGSPPEELLDSLAWALDAGAAHPVVRLFVMHHYLDQYIPLLTTCRDRLGTKGWRLTVDVPRFASDTLSKIAVRYPELAPALALELEPDRVRTLREIAGSSRRKVKDIRPPLELECQVYRRLRGILDRMGCQEVPLTPCKGDPEALLPLVREGVLCKFPCACYTPRP